MWNVQLDANRRSVLNLGEEEQLQGEARGTSAGRLRDVLDNIYNRDSDMKANSTSSFYPSF